MAKEKRKPRKTASILDEARALAIEVQEEHVEDSLAGRAAQKIWHLCSLLEGLAPELSSSQPPPARKPWTFDAKQVLRHAEQLLTPPGGGLCRSAVALDVQGEEVDPLSAEARSFDLRGAIDAALAQEERGLDPTFFTAAEAIMLRQVHAAAILLQCPVPVQENGEADLAAFSDAHSAEVICAVIDFAWRYLADPVTCLSAEVMRVRKEQGVPV